MKNNKGITLVSLIITIIVMVILAGVAMLFSVGEEGIIARAEMTKKEYKYIEQLETVKTQIKYQEDGKIDLNATKNNIDNLNLDGVNAEVDNKNQKLVVSFENSKKYEISGVVNENDIDNSHLIENIKIGDYVAYAQNNEESYTVKCINSGRSDGYDYTRNVEDKKWRVFYIDNENKKILLISDSVFSGCFPLQGVLGYNNGVYLLNDFCEKLYSNPSIGAVGRSITIEDIEKVIDISKYNYKESGDYGKEIELAAGSYPFQMVEQINKNISPNVQTALTTEKKITTTDKMIIKTNYWNNGFSKDIFVEADTRNISNSKKIYRSLLQSSKIYWFATRVYGNGGYGLYFYSPDEAAFRWDMAALRFDFYARPMVELPFSAIDFDATSEEYNEETGGWQIVK